MTDEQWMQALNAIGEVHDNDFDYAINGKLSFRVITPADSNNHSNPVLVATYERALEEVEPREGNGDYGAPEIRRWMLVPFEGASRGVALTGPVVDKLAREAEDGYPAEKLRPRSAGRE